MIKKLVDSGKGLNRHIPTCGILVRRAIFCTEIGMTYQKLCFASAMRKQRNECIFYGFLAMYTGSIHMHTGGLLMSFGLELSNRVNEVKIVRCLYSKMAELVRSSEQRCLFVSFVVAGNDIS
jgi:hypothetical protein